MKFLKYESNGNDFIILINTSNICAEKITILCDRHRGVGADGVLMLSKNKDQSFSLDIYNSDGSKASMCGNGLKICGRYLKDYYPNYPFYWVKVCGKSYQIFVNKEKVKLFMPIPKKVKIDKRIIYDIGNLHLLVENLNEDEQILLAKHYPKINVSSYKIKKNLKIKSVFIRTYEVGVGFTLSCGSASLCLYKLLIDQGYKENKLNVATLGGEFSLHKKGNRLVLTGNPKFIFEGEWNNEIFFCD